MTSGKWRLRALAARAAGAGRFIVVSNREPFIEERQGDRVSWKRAAGGLTSALHPVLSAVEDGVWVTRHSGTTARRSVPLQLPYRLRRVEVPEKLASEYYNGMANQCLWPLCHSVFQRPRFSRRDWDSYRKVNAMFAEAILDEAAGQPGTVFIQDYHFALLPRMLKEQNPALTVTHFWHIPWPNPEIFAAFPWKEELLNGLLGSDLLGFHLKQYCSNFLDSAAANLEVLVERELGRVASGETETAVRHFPIGIDFEAHCDAASSAATLAATEEWRRRIRPGVQIGIGIDRIDYTKGIPERIRALDLFLERHPEWRAKLVFVQVGVPSRCDIREYRLLGEEIEQEVAAVNRRWRTATWQPVHFVRRNLPLEEMIALHRLAAFCLVTSLHDGMNLVAKEFVASRSDLDGVLVLSRFAGACRELSSAVLVNPFCEDDIAQGIFNALSLPAAERRRRMARMRAAVEANDVFRWAGDIISALADVGVANTRTQAAAARFAGAGASVTW